MSQSESLPGQHLASFGLTDCGVIIGKRCQKRGIVRPFGAFSLLQFNGLSKRSQGLVVVRATPGISSAQILVRFVTFRIQGNGLVLHFRGLVVFPLQQKKRAQGRELAGRGIGRTNTIAFARGG